MVAETLLRHSMCMISTIQKAFGIFEVIKQLAICYVEISCSKLSFKFFFLIPGNLMY